MMTALHIPTPPEDLPRSVGDALQSSGFADSHFLQKHVNRNRMPFAQVEFSARGYLSCSDSRKASFDEGVYVLDHGLLEAVSQFFCR